MAQVSGIEVVFKANTAELDKGVAQAESRLTKFSSLARTGMIALGAAGTTAATGLALATQAAINHADEIGKMAQKVGMTTEALSRLEYAARLSDVSLGELQVGLGQLSKNMEAGTAGLDALGISVMTADGRLRSTNEVFLEVAERFSTIEDGAGKTAIAMDIFGRSGANLIPLLNSGRDGLAEMAAEADRLGLTISGNASQAAERFNDNVTRIQAALGGLTSQIAQGVAPRMADLTERMIDFYKETNAVETVVQAVNFVMTELAKFAIMASQALTEVVEVITFLGDAVERLGSADFAGIGDAWVASQQRVKAALIENSRLMDELNGKAQTVNRDGKGDLPTPKGTAPAMPSKGDGLSKSSTDSQPFSMSPSQEPGSYFTDRLAMIQEQFATERELLAEEYILNQEVLDNALANKLLKEQEYYDLSKKLAQDHQASLAAIQSSRLDGDLAAASSFFGSMASVAQAGGKRMLKVAKAAAAAQAIVDTIRAAVSAMNDPTAITPIQKFANYAAVFAKGMSAVAAIKGVSDGGGGGGGGGSGGGGRGGPGMASGGAGGGGAGPTTTFAFTLTNDPMGFGEKFARQFIDQLNSTQRNGGQIRGVIA